MIHRLLEHAKGKEGLEVVVIFCLLFFLTIGATLFNLFSWHEYSMRITPYVEQLPTN